MIGLRVTGDAACGRYRDRSRAASHRAAAPARRGLQVHRILRIRARQPRLGHARDGGQHGARVRRDRRVFPVRSHYARLPATDRPHGRAHRARRRVHDGAASCGATTIRFATTTRSRSTWPTVEPSLAGPYLPHQRQSLGDVPRELSRRGHRPLREGCRAAVRASRIRQPLAHGALVLAAITSCTNTSNPNLMIRPGLLARNARRRGLAVKPWVKTSLSPGSRTVSDYLRDAGLMDDLEALGFHVVGLRMHDLHRQLGAARAARRDAGGRGPAGCRRALRQPQLRGTRATEDGGRLSRLPAPGRRLRAGRNHHARHREDADRQRPGG